MDYLMDTSRIYRGSVIEKANLGEAQLKPKEVTM